MLKSALIVIISSVSLLSISSIVHANEPSILKTLTSNSANQVKPLLIAEKPTSTANNIPSSDLKGISQAISQYYGKWNERLAPSENSWSGACRFFEVKSLKLVSFSDRDAQVETQVKSTFYTLSGIHILPRQWAFSKMDRPSFQMVTHNVNLQKTDGKWKTTN